jgi:hypothetical protein
LICTQTERPTLYGRPFIDSKEPQVTKKSIPDGVPDDPDDLFNDSPTPTPADPAPDPFNPESLRLSQDFGSRVGAKKRQMVFPCGKPGRQEFIRIRSGAEWRLETAVFEEKALRETYLVDPLLWSEVADIAPVVLFTAITRQGDVFLWRCNLPSADGRPNRWNESALAAAELAEQKWVRVASNMASGCYDVWEATGNLPDPEWPDLTFPQILKLCFKDRFIRDLDHPVLKALRGEA